MGRDPGLLKTRVWDPSFSSSRNYTPSRGNTRANSPSNEDAAPALEHDAALTLEDMALSRSRNVERARNGATIILEGTWEDYMVARRLPS